MRRRRFRRMGAAMLLASTASIGAGVGTAPAGAEARVRIPRGGALDTSFGAGGIVITDVSSGFDSTAAVVVQHDGKVVVAGAWGTFLPTGSTSDFGLARYDRRGSLDPTFGDGGIVRTDFVGGSDSISGLVVQADGKLVAAGTAFPVSGSGPDFALARYNPDGSLDPSFGTGGEVATDIDGHDVAGDVALQADGRLVVAGFATTPFQEPWDFALARYNPDGSLDPSFGTGGTVTTDFAGHLDQANAVVVQPDGKVVAAGLAETDAGFAFAAARYDQDGSLDPRFGVGGRATTQLVPGAHQEAHDLAVAPDGKLTLVGTAGTWGLVRYRADGTLDRRFGGDGIVVDERIGGAANAVAVTRGGGVLVAGSATIGGTLDFALARYRADGRLDKRFGTRGTTIRGTTITDIAGGADVANALAVQGDGKVVLTGVTDSPPASPDAAVAVVRYHGVGGQRTGSVATPKRSW